MIISTLAALLLMSSAPGIQVDVGRIDRAGLPELPKVERMLPTPKMVDSVEQMLAEGECRIPGQSSKRFDIDVPYAVLVQPDGSAGRVVVTDMGCPPLETLTGLVVLELAREGSIKPTGEAKARWFWSKLNYNLQ
jgi:hypothetical protein